jgi:hypothetical protein
MQKSPKEKERLKTLEKETAIIKDLEAFNMIKE